MKIVRALCRPGATLLPAPSIAVAPARPTVRAELADGVTEVPLHPGGETRCRPGDRIADVLHRPGSEAITPAGAEPSTRSGAPDSETVHDGFGGEEGPLELLGRSGAHRLRYRLPPAGARTGPIVDRLAADAVTETLAGEAAP